MRLQFFILTTLIIYISNALYAQIEYTDFEPDLSLKPSSYIDIDGDQSMDFRLGISYDPYMGELSAYCQSISPGSGLSPNFVNAGDTIGQSTYFQTDLFVYIHNPVVKFIPFRFLVSSSYYYGWFRVHFNGSSNSILLDYAINSIPDQPIIASEGLQNRASELELLDVDDNQNGSDLRYSFKRAFFYDSVQEYRCLILDTNLLADTAIIDYDTITNYLSVLPQSGITYSNNFPANTRTIHGEPISNGNTYCLLVQTVSADPAFSALSFLSQALTLESRIEDIGNFSVLDNGNTNTVEDIEVFFSPSPDEVYIEEYRIFIAPAFLSDLVLTDLEQNTNYKAVAPQGGFIQVNLDPGQKDIQGNDLVPGERYKTFILNIPYSGIGWSPSLSQKSNNVIIDVPDVFITGQYVDPAYQSFQTSTFYDDYVINSTHIDLNNDGIDDLYFFYDSWYGAGQYSVSTVTAHSLNGTSFRTVTDGLERQYEPINELGNWYGMCNVWWDGVSSGNPIHSGWNDFPEAYLVFRISIQGEYAYGWMKFHEQGSHIYASDYEILPTSIGGNKIGLVHLTDSSDSQNASDLHIKFGPSPLESWIHRYRIFIYPDSTSIPSIELLNSSINYRPVIPTGDSISVSCLSNQKDVFNNSLQTGVSYRVAILSKMKNGSGLLNTINSISNSAIISEPNINVSGDTSGLHYHYLDSISLLNTMIDINGDSINDLLFGYHTISVADSIGALSDTSVYYVQALNGFEVKRSMTGLEYRFEPLVSNGEWSGVQYYSHYIDNNEYGLTVEIADWVKYQPGYLLFRYLSDSSEYLYGWLNICSDGDYKAVDYAYEKVSSQTDTVHSLSGLCNQELITVFPNPSQNIVFVEIHDDTQITKEVILHNNQGQIVLWEHGIMSNNVILDVSALKNGIYFYRISTIERSYIGKLVIKH